MSDAFCSDFKRRLQTDSSPMCGCAHLHMSDRDSVSKPKFETIDAMSDGLGLASTIKDRANEIFKMVEDHKFFMGRIHENKDAYLAACLRIAYDEENKLQPPIDICSVANGARRQQICDAQLTIMNKLGLVRGVILDFVSPPEIEGRIPL
ncbi:TFIIB transcription factor [Trema orientale]|uniref:TFIIB transcription factor n=1 Tax=Trema orientale TaxID=63057 RepID=A0A2P5E686_TREOI|nr:TFIIB transcription factor [Trema orientale]